MLSRTFKGLACTDINIDMYNFYIPKIPKKMSSFKKNCRIKLKTPIYSFYSEDWTFKYKLN